MADIITITFSLVSLICGIISSFWLFKLKDFISEKHATYVLSALIATSFLISFPLWTLFSEFFTFSATIKRVSYLLFSVGYFGVLIISYLSVENIGDLKDKIRKMELAVETTKKIPSVKKENLKTKIQALQKASYELDKYKQFSEGIDQRMLDLQREIEKLKETR